MEIPEAAGTVLVVEDDDLVRKLVVRVLSRAGYAAVGVGTGAEAIRLAGSSPVSIDLLLSDVVLPDARGPELYAAARGAQPAMKVVFMSGYPEQMVASADGELAGPFLRKPFSPAELLRLLKELIPG